MRAYFSRTVLLALTLSAAAPSGAGERDDVATFPSRPIRIVIGFTPGGQPDITARVIAVKLTESLGQQVVVDNRPGAGGTIGARIVAEATPDGHTLLSVYPSHSISPSVYAKLAYDTRRDFAGITTTVTGPYLLIVPRRCGKSMPDCSR